MRFLGGKREKKFGVRTNGGESMSSLPSLAAVRGDGVGQSHRSGSQPSLRVLGI
jgi:hypothetical protein